MITAEKHAADIPIRVLLVGEREEDFFLIQEILERNRRVLDVSLEHARSIDEAKAFLQQKPFSLVLFEYEAGDAESIRLMAEFLRAGVSLPFILLTEDANEAKVAGLIEGGCGTASINRNSTMAHCYARFAAVWPYIRSNRNETARKSCSENCPARLSNPPILC